MLEVRLLIVNPAMFSFFCHSVTWLTHFQLVMLQSQLSAPPAALVLRMETRGRPLLGWTRGCWGWKPPPGSHPGDPAPAQRPPAEEPPCYTQAKFPVLYFVPMGSCSW